MVTAALLTELLALLELLDAAELAAELDDEAAADVLSELSEPPQPASNSASSAAVAQPKTFFFIVMSPRGYLVVNGNMLGKTPAGVLTGIAVLGDAATNFPPSRFGAGGRVSRQNVQQAHSG